MLPTVRYAIKEKLSFPRGVLELLRETRLFGREVEKAIEDIDDILDLMDELEEPWS